MPTHERFSRTALLLGDTAMETLRRARIAVFGLGGVGGFTVEFLARSGAGSFCLFDFDRISPSNCNRLPIAGTATLGLEKSAALRARILDINPEAVVRAEPLFLGGDAAPELLAREQFDLVIDAIDSLNPKIGLLEAAAKGGQRVVSSMGAAARTDPSQVHSTQLWKTKHCPLAAKVRAGLRKRGVRTKIPVVYSTEFPLPPHPPEMDTAVDASYRHPVGRIRNIQPSGAWIPAVFAAHLMHLALVELGVLEGE